MTILYAMIVKSTNHQNERKKEHTAALKGSSNNTYLSGWQLVARISAGSLILVNMAKLRWAG